MKPFVSLCLLSALCALPAAAQPTTRPARPATTAPPPQPAPPPAPALTPQNIAGTIKAAEQKQNADALLVTYGTAITDPFLARAALGQLLASYYQMRSGAQTADQATQAVAEADLRFSMMQAAQNQVIVQQNQLLIQQNARIVALLEQMAKK